MNWLYLKILWFWGFRLDDDPPIEGVPDDSNTEKITYMLRRQKHRLGKFWWAWSIGWLAFWVWLFLHILQAGGL